MSSCGCSAHGHVEHNHEGNNNLKVLATRLSAALILLIVASFMELDENMRLGIFLGAYILAGYQVVFYALRGVFAGELFNENFLMTIASLGAFGLGDMPEAVAVMIFFGIGELLQGAAVQRSRKSIAELMDIRPDHANLKLADRVEIVKPEQVSVGDLILVKPGERIPLDGKVVSGESFLDTQALTGESVPKRVSRGGQVYAGAINTQGLLEIRVSKIFAESTAMKILQLVENAQERKSPSEQFISKFARVYTPAVVGIALLVAIIPPIMGYGTYSVWLYRALTFLIVSCPCALVVAIPVSFFGGIGGAAQHGILIKGGNYLEALNDLRTVVFDKTGTLTKGVFEVGKVQAANGFKNEDVLRFAAIAEANSTHPIAKAILQANNQELEPVIETTERAGMGVIVHTVKDVICVGSAKMLAEMGIENLPTFSQTSVYVLVNDIFAGYILIADQPKPGIAQSINELRALGIRQITMLTGDTIQVAAELATTLGISYRANLLPQDKVEALEQIMSADTGGRVAFVGDGINDAPVITRADIGVAMGGIGSDAAIEAADIVIMNDDIGKLSLAIKIARKTRMIVNQNIVLALGIKLAVMVLAFLGYTSMWAAIFADVGVALMAIANAVRAMRV